MIKGASPIPPQKGRANQLAWGGLAAMFKIVRLIFFALIVQLRISAWLSFSNKGEAPSWDKMQISGMNGSKVF